MRLSHSPLLAAAVALTACNQPEEGVCDPASQELSVVLGTGVDQAFDPLEPGDTASLVTAPQGGMGVSVRALTTGLKTGPVDVLLDTELDGQTVGSFVNEGVRLYCQEDDTHGLIWGVVVGFDPQEYRTNDQLLSLDGEEVDLVVTVTDSDGVSGVGTVPVIIEVE